jgi:hypothetical protein
VLVRVHPVAEPAHLPVGVDLPHVDLVFLDDALARG